ncbi:siroheme synthase [Lichenicoccus sp.]|uniref:siroheme synthase n=1 Tax=Lichenicoccus sp. TaxID=2781899 RepID=UPI003D0B9DBE
MDLPRRLPLFLDLDGRRALLLGEGEAAERRADSLRDCGAVVVRALAFNEARLDGCAIAVGAAEGAARAPGHPMQVALAAMAAAARARGIPCNVVDQPELGSFITPAVVLRPPLAIAISSGGASPVLARLLRARIEAAVAPGFGKLAAFAGRMQAQTRAAIPDVLRRRRMLEAALSGAVAELMLAGREAEAEAAYLSALRDAAEGLERPARGFVHLVHPGPGEADLLTLRALRLLGEADVIVHHPQESPAVLEVARRDASRCETSDEAAPAMLVGLARDGGRIVRLSPTTADRAALLKAAIDHEAVPGVAPAQAVATAPD